MKPVIGCLGAGRMGRGIAVVFAFAGHQVVVVDFKERETSAFDTLAVEARAEIRSTLEILSRIGLLPPALVPTIAERITVPQAIYQWKRDAQQRRLAEDLQISNREALEAAFRRGLAVVGYERDAGVTTGTVQLKRRSSIPRSSVVLAKAGTHNHRC